MNMTLLQKLEDLFNREGLPTICRKLSEAEIDEFDIRKDNINQYIDVIFPLGKESLTYQCMHKNKLMIRDLVQDTFTIKMHTILYFMAYVVFGRLASPAKDYYISVNFLNKKDPRQKRTNAGLVYEYDLDLISIDQRSWQEDIDSIKEKVRGISSAFNQTSRFIKIGQLRLAFSNTPFVFKGSSPPQFTVIKLD